MAPKPLNRFWWNSEYITMSAVEPHKEIQVALWQHGLPRHTNNKSRFRFLNQPFFIIWLMSRLCTSGLIQTISTSYDEFLCKEVPFGGQADTAHIKGVECTKKLNLRARKIFFKPNAQNIQTSVICMVETTPVIQTKFCTMIFVPKYVQQIEDSVDGHHHEKIINC